jgi:hypothetical protein
MLALPAQPLYLRGATLTGVIASSYVITLSAVLDYALRFTTTYEEYRILGVDMKVISGNATPGVSVFLWDETSTTAPTGQNAQEKTHEVRVNNSCNSKSQAMMSWRARDTKDLQYVPIGTSYAPVTFKVYTNSSTYGSGTDLTNRDTAEWYLEPTIYFEFRGVASV